jgi:hypothetical protein
LVRQSHIGVSDFAIVVLKIGKSQTTSRAILTEKEADMADPMFREPVFLLCRPKAMGNRPLHSGYSTHDKAEAALAEFDPQDGYEIVEAVAGPLQAIQCGEDA